MPRRFKLPLFSLTFIALVLIALHISLPILLRDYLNKQMAVMGDYRGHIADIDLALWRGAYRINDLEITKLNSKVAVPLLKAPHIDLAISWHALWQQHSIVARVVFTQPELTFVDGATAASSQTGAGVDWQAQLRGLLPIHLNEVQVVNGTLAWRNFSSQPTVNLQATQLNAQILNISNVKRSSQPRPAALTATANVLGNAPLELKADFDPIGELDDFDLQLRITQVPLKQLNSFTRAYANFDFSAGTGDLVMELQARQGKLTGYAKPLLRQMQIFNWQQDITAKDKSLLSGAWEAMVGSAGWLFKNHSQDQLASRINISGDLTAYKISRWQAFKGILRNAFVKAFNSQFDSKIR